RFTPASAVDNNGAAGRPLREKLRQQRIPIVLVKKRGSFHVIGGILRLRPRIHPKKWRGPRAQFPGGDELATGSGGGGARAPAARRLQLPLHERRQQRGQANEQYLLHHASAGVMARA